MRTALFIMMMAGLIIFVVFSFRTLKAAIGSRYRSDTGSPYLWGTITALGLGLAVISVLLGNQLHRDEYNDAISKGYMVYVDGQEADANGVAIDNYTMEIDNESQVVRLTKRSQNSYTPIFIPIGH